MISNDDFFRVFCDGCGCETSNGQTVFQAIDAWNRRQERSDEDAPTQEKAREMPKPRPLKILPQVRIIKINDDKMSPGRLVAAAEYVEAIMIWQKSNRADPKAREIADRHYSRQNPVRRNLYRRDDVWFCTRPPKRVRRCG